MQQAWVERTNQVCGTNQHSIIELGKAYFTGDPQQELVQKVTPNRIALAKRISVLNNFNNLNNKRL